MKKFINIFISCSIMYVSFCTPLSSVNAKESLKRCNPIIISENDIKNGDEYSGWDFRYVSETDFEIIVPYESGETKSSGSYEESIARIQPRSISAIATWIFGTCQVVQWVSNKDVCGYLIRQSLNLLKTTRKPLPNGKYKVTYTYVKARTPGCEPIHSGPCNTGYWKITYHKIG